MSILIYLLIDHWERSPASAGKSRSKAGIGVSPLAVAGLIFSGPPDRPGGRLWLDSLAIGIGHRDQLAAEASSAMVHCRRRSLGLAGWSELVGVGA